MLRIYHSNHLDILKSLMEFVTEHQPLNDPLKSEIVLVQNVSMAQWIKISLAQKFGIIANIEFPLPNNFIWDMFVQILPGVPEQSNFNKQAMTWKLMILIPKLLQNKKFSILCTYLNKEYNKQKIFQLASQIADLYDRYLVYRPYWLICWENGKQIAGLPKAQIWQADLWKALVEYTLYIGQATIHHASLYERFISILEKETVSLSTVLQKLPDRIFVFGISILPPVYLKILYSLSKHIDIHIFFTNPCRHYWGDIQDVNWLMQLVTPQRRNLFSGKSIPLLKKTTRITPFFEKNESQNLSNVLLASWGKLGRDYMSMLSDVTTLDEEDIDAFVDITPDCLLHNLQHDILEMKDSFLANASIMYKIPNNNSKRWLNPKDRSITIHVCYSIQREIEVLHDNLLAMLDNDSNLNPRDIIVMVTDINTYHPFIRAVFNSATEKRYIPYSISDCSVLQSHPILEAFINLLSLTDSRFVSEDILALLDVPMLAAKFEISEEELQYLRQWLNESGICWGIDDSNIKELGLPVTGQHTWQFGLTRMLLGHAMESRYGEWNEVLPYDQSNGLTVELIGNLASLLMHLNHWRHNLKQDRSLKEWLPICRYILNDFFLLNQETEEVVTFLEQQWYVFLKEGVNSCYNDSIPVTIIRDEIMLRLDKEHINQFFLAGSVNICGIMSMRSIPFKIICLLGMNDGVYPRVVAPVEFNMMNHTPQRGDYNYRDNDRYMFLEALIAAQQKLYISYIGRSIQDNSERLPSVLVQELVDYIGQSHYLSDDETCNHDHSEHQVKEHITFIHSLMPFDMVNYANDELRSFSWEWLPAAKKMGAEPSNFIQELDDLPFTKLSFEKLQYFWTHPVRAFFQIRLQVNFKLETNKISNAEPFNLDNLNRYKLNQQLLNALIKKDSQELFYRYKAAGQLPYGAFGEIIWETQYKEMQILASKVMKHMQPATTQEIDLECSGVQLIGWLHHIQSDGLLRWSPSIFNVSQGMKVWLEHLVYCVYGGNGESRLFMRKEKEWCFPPISKECALYYLSQFIEGYKRGMRKPLLLLPESGGEWIKTCYNAEKDSVLTDKLTLQKARTKFFKMYNGSMIIRGEGNDIWYRRLWKTPNSEQFDIITKEAKRYLLPLYRVNHSKYERTE